MVCGSITFREEDLGSRAEFAAVAAEFTATTVVAPVTLLGSVADFIRSITARPDDVVIADSLIPFRSSLVAWGHDDDVIGRFLRELSVLLEPVSPILVYLDGDPVVALRRAADRELGWRDWFIAKLAGYRVSPQGHVKVEVGPVLGVL